MILGAESSCQGRQGIQSGVFQFIFVDVDQHFFLYGRPEYLDPRF